MRCPHQSRPACWCCSTTLLMGGLKHDCTGLGCSVPASLDSLNDVSCCVQQPCLRCHAPELHNSRLQSMRVSSTFSCQCPPRPDQLPSWSPLPVLPLAWGAYLTSTSAASILTTAATVTRRPGARYVRPVAATKAVTIVGLTPPAGTVLQS